ncbi:MAG: DUF4181 domain-containing protein [Atopostipes suicloacalis]|nr:DUF4181 domain-containing protein [Atopostipes suicloacalis]
MFPLALNFWVKLFLLLAIFFFALFIFNFFMKKILGLKHRKVFSYRHVNEGHKKADWMIRSLFVVLFIAAYIIVETFKLYSGIWPYILPILLIFYVISSELLRAYMEWSYQKHSKDYLFTLSQLAFLLLSFWISFQIDFLHLF